MAVQAKFYVAEVTKYPSRGGFAAPAPLGKVVLAPVTRGEENREWASATPSGRIEMTVHGDAITVFESWLGKDVSIRFDAE